MNKTLYHSDIYYDQHQWICKLTFTREKINSLVEDVKDMLQDPFTEEIHEPLKMIKGKLLHLNQEIDKKLNFLNNYSFLVERYEEVHPLSACTGSYQKHTMMNHAIEMLLNDYEGLKREVYAYMLKYV